jgi:hypothetical protein
MHFQKIRALVIIKKSLKDKNVMETISQEVVQFVCG